jgi:hypothetical protein
MAYGIWLGALLLLLLLPCSPSRKPTTAAWGVLADIAYISHWCPTQRP